MLPDLPPRPTVCNILVRRLPLGRTAAVLRYRSPWRAAHAGAHAAHADAHAAHAGAHAAHAGDRSRSEDHRMCDS